MPNKTTPVPPWASSKIEPKRQFKFILTLGDIPAWVITDAKRPGFTISSGAKHDFLGHQFKYPGRISWGNFTCKLVEPIDPDVSGVFFEAIQKAGYTLPGDWREANEGWRKTFSKNKFVNGNFGDISCKMLDSEGNVVEKWTLRNAWVSGVDYGALNYSSDALTNISLTFEYDYADLEITAQDLNAVIA